jgi:hypothetical protein
MSRVNLSFALVTELTCSMVDMCKLFASHAAVLCMCMSTKSENHVCCCEHVACMKESQFKIMDRHWSSILACNVLARPSLSRLSLTCTARAHVSS